MGLVTRRVAIPVGVIARRTMGGELFSARRLGELPDRSVSNASYRRGRRIGGKSAAGRGRASIVVDKKREILRRNMGMDVVGGGDRTARFLLHRHGGAIYAGTKTLLRERVDPSAQVGMIRSRQAAAFLDIQKDDRASWKALFLRD